MSLGWDKQELRVRIEWEHTDIALFVQPIPKKSNLWAIIETKRLWMGLGNASDQAKRYAKKYPHCKRLVVSDGIRYWLYKKLKNERNFPPDPFAYFNLLTPTRNHPHKRGIKGAISFLSEMIPKQSR
jgi:hypothetical protein